MSMTSDCTVAAPRTESIVTVPAKPAAASDWRGHLPVLRAGNATLRELEISDAASLFESLTREEVTRFISPPPATIDGFERFIAWTRHEQSHGRYVCYGIVPEGEDRVVGIIQLRQLDNSFTTAEWGFALGSDYWGTGLFHESALAVINFAFDQVGVHRLEARAAVANGRGNAALRKLGATPEGVLRRSFLRYGEYLDQVLWGLVATDWVYFQPGAGQVH
jgi:[ribosomal protein S5]-alanine N-acetyltransferase